MSTLHLIVFSKFFEEQSVPELIATAHEIGTEGDGIVANHTDT